MVYIKNRIPIHYPNKNCGLPNWVPSINNYYDCLNTNSWFDMNICKNPNKSSVKRHLIDAPIVPNESYKQQMKSIKRCKSNKEPVFIYTRKIRIYPTDDQKCILEEWFWAATRMYNITVKYIRDFLFKDHKLTCPFASKDILINFPFRTVLKEDRDKLMKSMKNPIVGHLLDEIIAQVVSNYKAAISNILVGNIKKFKISTWKYIREKYILKIEKNLFSNGTFCSRTFKELKSSEPLINIQHTCTLQYNRDIGKYILLVPTHKETKSYVTNDLDCGIDLGVRTFATVYSRNNVVTIGNKFKKIDSCHKKIDKINELLDSDNNKCKLRKAKRKYYRRIKDIITDMHYKSAYYLVTNYDNIHIGKLSTKGILSKNNKKISRHTKRMVGVLSPYLFRQRLNHMAHKYGATVFEVNEYLTTKTCSNCGKINELEAKKVHKCKCGMKTDRDVNAAKNILKVGYQYNSTLHQVNDIDIIETDNHIVTFNKVIKEYEVFEV
ncbi:transposase [Megavirus chiliensis]|uniref:Transposase mobile element n=3 Tax=Megamimivirinae TaxID=3044648 RepID=A0A2L2DNW3_MIMIV|nr:transposase [Megavirus chiliensis]AEQ33346.1 transposase [Megavirus chiliensis]AVG47858.1 transposase mobile element [Acanthamoeba polyphaga mimivirus]